MAQEMVILGAASIASLAGREIVGCFSRRHRKLKLERSLESALILSKGTGKSKLCSALEGHANMKVIDLMAIVDRKLKAGVAGNVVLVKSGDTGANDLERMIEAKKIYDELRKSLPKYKLVVVCDTIEEARYLGIADENIIVCTPCERLFTEMILKGKEIREREDIIMKRLHLISQCDGEVINKFNTFDELYSVIKGAYKLSSKF